MVRAVFPSSRLLKNSRRSRCQRHGPGCKASRRRRCLSASSRSDNTADGAVPRQPGGLPAHETGPRAWRLTSRVRRPTAGRVVPFQGEAGAALRHEPPAPGGTGRAGRLALSARSSDGPASTFARFRAMHPGPPPSRPRSIRGRPQGRKGLGAICFVAARPRWHRIALLAAPRIWHPKPLARGPCEFLSSLLGPRPSGRPFWTGAVPRGRAGRSSPRT